MRNAPADFFYINDLEKKNLHQLKAFVENFSNSNELFFLNHEPNFSIRSIKTCGFFLTFKFIDKDTLKKVHEDLLAHRKTGGGPSINNESTTDEKFKRRNLDFLK